MLKNMPRPMNLRDYQTGITRMLAAIFPGVHAKREWATGFGSKLYSPRLDAAVGPFATGSSQHAAEYDAMASSHRELLKKLFVLHGKNVTAYGDSESLGGFDSLQHHNSNARCFLGIEIENDVSRKHLMGGALNASALSRIALLVGWQPDKLKALVKLRGYLLNLDRLGKPTFNMANLLVLSPDQLWEELVHCPRGSA